jgi:hypothetical protein
VRVVLEFRGRVRIRGERAADEEQDGGRFAPPASGSNTKNRSFRPPISL